MFKTSSDCLRYKITTKKQHEGNNFRSVGAYAFIPDEDICLQLCLHFTGCMGSTFKELSQTCVLHGSNDSSYKRSDKEMTFVGITCLGMHFTSHFRERNITLKNID